MRDETGRRPPGTLTYLADLGFPCHMECVVCDRVPPSAAAYHAVRRRLTGLATVPNTEVLRAAFFGGDVFALPRSFEALLSDAREACERRGVAFEAAVLSDGVAWRRDVVERFGALGATTFQVTLDGPRETHDRLHPTKEGGGSFDRVLASIKHHRGSARVVVRMKSSLGHERAAALAATLSAEGLFDGPNPVVLYVAPMAPYRDQASELLALDELRRTNPRVAGAGALMRDVRPDA